MLSLLLVVLPALQNYHRGFQQVPKQPPHPAQPAPVNQEKQEKVFTPFDLLKMIVPQEILNGIPKEISNREVTTHEEKKEFKTKEGTGHYMRIIQIVRPKHNIPNAFLYPELPNQKQQNEAPKDRKYYVNRYSPGTIRSYTKGIPNANPFIHHRVFIHHQKPAVSSEFSNKVNQENHQNQKAQHVLISSLFNKDLPFLVHHLRHNSLQSLNPVTLQFNLRHRSRRALSVLPFSLKKHHNGDDNDYSGSDPLYYSFVIHVFGFVTFCFFFIFIILCCRRMCARQRRHVEEDEYVPPIVNQPVPYQGGYYIYL
jgi:hypothetical protein